MSSANVDFVVGMIAIESTSDPGPDRGALVECDATLDEFLIHLASDRVGVREAVETSGRLTASDRFGGPARLSARLENLAAELELAVAQVRRKIAAALQSAA